MAALLVVFATLALTLTELGDADLTHSAQFMAVQFEVLSAWGTVGLTTGIIPDLSPLGRFIIILVMYIGRIGPLTPSPHWR